MMSAQCTASEEVNGHSMTPLEANPGLSIQKRDPEEDTSTVCTPSTPALSRNTRPESSSHNQTQTSHLTLPRLSQTSGVTHGCYDVGVSPSLAKGLEEVIRLLWSRDDMSVVSTYTPYTTEYRHVRRCSLKYINMYMSTLSIIPDDCWSIVLAGIFLAFKSADFIPGKGRVRMNQLLDAFAVTKMSSVVDDKLINDICKIEMKMMCQCNFRFD